MQDKIILGILQCDDKTSYEIKKSIEKSTALFYNASMGSIHPALKKLEAAGCISVTGRIENGRAKKIYSITGQGRKMFTQWLSEGLPLEKFKDETLVRLFFFSHLDSKERLEHIKTHIVSLQEQIVVLEALRGQLVKTEISDEMKSNTEFQFATLDFGLNYFKFASEWYKKFLKEIS